MIISRIRTASGTPGARSRRDPAEDHPTGRSPTTQPTTKPDNSAGGGGEPNTVDRHPDRTITHNTESDDHTDTDD